MKELAAGLHQLHGFPPNAINVYLMGDVLVDAGTRYARGRILRQLRGHEVKAHALTHAHPDHQGSSHAVCNALNIPLWCGAADAPAVENPKLIKERLPRHWLNHLIGSLWTGPAQPVARLLREGDEVGGFTVIETPGHCVGHVSYWSEKGRVLVLGDVLANLNILTGLPGLHEPPDLFTFDPPLNRQSARKVAALRPELVCFGHGPPLRNAQKFLDFVNKLPD
jgi:hydroxyacylglutathione hydrolase